jgi:hypothetical protein
MSCDNPSISTVIKRAWTNSLPYDICALANEAISKVGAAKGLNLFAAGLNAPMMVAIVTMEDSSADPNAIECTSSSCDCSTCDNYCANSCGYGLTQITTTGHITELIDLGLAPSGTTLCDMLQHCDENGPLYTMEALVVHFINTYLNSNSACYMNLGQAYMAWNSGDGACGSSLDAYGQCALDAYNGYSCT